MKKFVVLVGIAVAGLLFAGLGTSRVLAEEKGGLKMPTEEITIEGKKPARFDHTKHMALEGVSCGQCHHGKEHQELTEEEVLSLPKDRQLACISCHNNEFPNEKLRKRSSIFHARCKECHKVGVGDIKGPTKCNDCHIKKKKK